MFNHYLEKSQEQAISGLTGDGKAIGALCAAGIEENNSGQQRLDAARGEGLAVVVRFIEQKGGLA